MGKLITWSILSSLSLLHQRSHSTSKKATTKSSKTIIASLRRKSQLTFHRICHNRPSSHNPSQFVHHREHCLGQAPTVANTSMEKTCQQTWNTNFTTIQPRALA